MGRRNTLANQIKNVALKQANFGGKTRDIKDALIAKGEYKFGTALKTVQGTETFDDMVYHGTKFYQCQLK